MQHEVEYLSDLFFYNPSSGVVLSRIYRGPGKNLSTKPVWPGKKADTSDGAYKRVNFDGSSLQVGRLAWLLMTGDIRRDTQIRHRDGNPSNNRFNNLESY